MNLPRQIHFGMKLNMNETFAAKGGRKEAVWTDLAKKLGLGNHGIGQIFIVVNGQRKEKTMQPSGHTGVSFEASNERCT